MSGINVRHSCYKSWRGSGRGNEHGHSQSRPSASLPSSQNEEQEQSYDFVVPPPKQIVQGCSMVWPSIVACTPRIKSPGSCYAVLFQKKTNQAARIHGGATALESISEPDDTTSYFKFPRLVIDLPPGNYCFEVAILEYDEHSRNNEMRKVVKIIISPEYEVLEREAVMLALPMQPGKFGFSHLLQSFLPLFVFFCSVFRYGS